MPVPVTRPIAHRVTTATPGTMPRAGSPALALPPSNGVTLPYGQGVVHTVKDPTHQVPTRSRVVAAAVT